MKGKLGLDTWTARFMLGGVLIAVAVIVLAACVTGMGDTCPVVDGSRDHCINP